jgi:hypothetical protein
VRLAVGNTTPALGFAEVDLSFPLHAHKKVLGFFMFNPWFSVTLKTIQLGFEAQNVIALRMMRLAAGGATAQTEARRMIADKMAAGIEVQAVAASSVTSGQKDTVVAGKILRVLKKRVHANKRRLSRR